MNRPIADAKAKAAQTMKGVEIPLVGAALENLRPEHAASLPKYANSRRVWLNLRDRFPHPYTEADAQSWIAAVGEESPPTHFAIVVGGEAVGGIGIHRQADVHRLTAEIGYWLGEPFWGRGLATQGLVAATQYAFRELDLVRLFANVFQHNPASCRVLEKAGFVREGILRRNVIKDGVILDSYLYGKLRDE